MGSTDYVHSGVAQTLGVAPLLAVGHGIADVGKVLMAVAAHKLMIGLAVEPETVLTTELSLADAHANNTAVDGLAAVDHRNLRII